MELSNLFDLFFQFSKALEKTNTDKTKDTNVSGRINPTLNAKL
ncbi:hypothetical protein [Chryseobacterium indoltheticum]